MTKLEQVRENVVDHAREVYRTVFPYQAKEFAKAMAGLGAAIKEYDAERKPKPVPAPSKRK